MLPCARGTSCILSINPAFTPPALLLLPLPQAKRKVKALIGAIRGLSSLAKAAAEFRGVVEGGEVEGGGRLAQLVDADKWVEGGCVRVVCAL